MELHNLDVYWIKQRIPKELWKLMATKRERLIVAGGFLRSVVTKEPINDIDCFTPSAAEAGNCALELAASHPSLHVQQTDNAYTVLGLKHAIQFIHRWVFDTPQKCIDSFDFTIARAAVWIGTGDQAKSDGSGHLLLNSVCDKQFYSDLAAKRLMYCKPIRNEDAGGSMLRLLKFYSRGYHAPLDTIAAVMARMVVAQEVFELKGVPEGRELQIANFLNAQLVEVDPDVEKEF